MTADPSPFIQGEWMHGFAPVVLVACIAFAIGFIIFGYIGTVCHSEEDGDDIDDFGRIITQHGEGGYGD